MQFIGFAGCAVTNTILAVGYKPLKELTTVFFLLCLGLEGHKMDPNGSQWFKQDGKAGLNLESIRILSKSIEVSLRYITQLSFQSLPGVTTMAISAEIYPSMVRGTGAGISAACGKLGATLGTSLELAFACARLVDRLLLLFGAEKPAPH